jgi:hypothetical protein
MLKLETAKMKNAIARAKAVKPTVRRIAERTYSVTSTDGSKLHTVTFSVANGLRLGSCTCKAHEAGLLCYHIAAAAALNIALHSTYSRSEATPQASDDLSIAA